MPDSIAILRYRALQAIDNAAADVRQRLITDITGQSETYASKRAEAKQFIADHFANPAATPGPYLTADIAENGGSALAKANAIIAASDNYSVNKDPPLEAKRTGGKARVRAATTPEDIAAERDAAIIAIESLVI